MINLIRSMFLGPSPGGKRIYAKNPSLANKPPSSHPYSGYSTSKFSLHGHRVLTTQSTGKSKTTPKQQVNDISASISTKANSNGFTFPKLTASPLRKFWLHDSDSDFDDSCANEYAKIKANKVNSSSKAKLHNPAEKPTISGQKSENGTDSVSRGKDLWDDFYAETRFNIPTPALYEVSVEYSKSVKHNRTDGVNCKFPAHRYFYHDDPRVRDLVCSRFTYFSLLSAINGGNQHTVPPVIDYMCQFNYGARSNSQAARKTNSGTGSKRVRNNPKKTNVDEAPEGSESWVNSRSGVSIPTDAAKRRVQAISDNSAGHWFTNSEGNKVYISKTGQELTGRDAYTLYKKESGKGYKRLGGKKKATATGKKSTSAKKK